MFQLSLRCEKFAAARHHSVIGNQLLFANNRNRVRWVVFCLSQDGACTGSFENFRENSLKGDLSNDITLNPPLFSLVNTFYCAYRLVDNYIYLSLKKCEYACPVFINHTVRLLSTGSQKLPARFLYQNSKYWIYLANLHTSQGHALPSSQHIISRKAISLPLNIQILTFSAWATTRQIKIKLCSLSR